MDTQSRTFPDTLTSAPGSDRIRAKRWLPCPRCGCGKVLKVLPTTQCNDLVVYCKVCRRESVVNIP